MHSLHGAFVTYSLATSMKRRNGPERCARLGTQRKYPGDHGARLPDQVLDFSGVEAPPKK